MSPISHSVLAMKLEQAPAESYTERMKHNQAKKHESKRLLSDKRENSKAVTQSSHGTKSGTIGLTFTLELDLVL